MRGHPPLGSSVAGYRLVSLVGEGATGAVYLAERAGSDERVALKLLDPELARDERFRRRFLRESELATTLQHPYVVPILDFGEADGDLFLAMRFIPGSDLRELLARDGALDPARALDLLAGVADALDVAHERGLVHRDVKPANILVDGDDAYLGDFGLAKHASSVSSLTGEHAFVGTIAYVSPEQIRGDELDGRADVYSLGCVLYECLAGAPPFDRESELAVVYAHLHERPPPLGGERPELPEGIDQVLRKATAKSPGERYETCAELIREARAAVAGERQPRRHIGALAAGVVGLAVVAAAVVLFTRGSDDHVAQARPLAVSGAGVSLVDAANHRVAGRVPLPERPVEIRFDAGSAWALLPGAQQVAQVDVARRKQVGKVALPFVPGGMALAAGSLYVTEQGGPGVVRVATATRKVTATWTVNTRGFRVSDPTGIAAGAGSVWLARGAEVVRVDARTGKVTRRFPLPVTATLVTFADGAAWAASSENGLVEKIDPASNRVVARAKLHGWISGLASAGGSVWAAVTPDDVVFRLSPDDLSVQGSVPAGEDPSSLAATRDALWIANSRGRALTSVDLGSSTRRSISTAGEPDLVRTRRGLLWTVAEPAPPALPAAANGPVIRVSLRDDALPLDPAPGAPPSVSQLLYATCVKLVDYPDAEGAAGRQLRPDGAAAMPAVSADGRTYTFRIRHGLRFSPPSGQVLDAAAFKHTLERTLSPRLGPDPNGLHVMGDVVGARAFNAGRAGHVSGLVAREDLLSITLQRPAGDLLSRLAMPLFCAVPSGTPAPPRVTGPIPSAGPYYVRSQTARRTVLDRNPNYGGSRPRRPARIVYLTGVPTAKAVALAAAGQADVVPWDFDDHGPLAPGGSPDRRAGERYRVAPAPGVDMIAFNTKRPLFRDARLRRAVSYAIDRRALAAVWNETPVDGYVPPAIPGPRAGRTYPVGGPDLERARRLARGSAGATASLYFCGEPANARVAEIVRRNLLPLGIHVAITPSLDCLNGADPKARSADLVLVTRATAELDPAPFLDAAVGDTFAVGSGPGPVTWDGAGFRDRLERANRLPEDERLAAYARIEDDMLRTAAPYAAFGSFVAPELRSARVGCTLIQGAYHVIDLGALCLRAAG